MIAPLRGHTDGVLSAVFDESGKYVLTASADQTARVWEVFSTPVSTSSSKEATIKSGDTFDFESGLSSINSFTLADIWWNQDNKSTRILTPLNNARLAVIGPLSTDDFDNLSLTELQGLNYSKNPLSGNDDKSNQLLNGNVLAVETESDEFTDYTKVQSLGNYLKASSFFVLSSRRV